MTKLTKTDVLKSETKVDEISKTELDTLKAEAAKVADLEKALADKSELETKLADLEKANADAVAQLADIKKAKDAQLLTDTVDVVKGFNSFEDADVEDVAKYFIANAGSVTNLILANLEKARTTIKTFGETEHGTDLEGNTEDTSKADTEALGASVMDIIKSRKAEK